MRPSSHVDRGTVEVVDGEVESVVSALPLLRTITALSSVPRGPRGPRGPRSGDPEKLDKQDDPKPSDTEARAAWCGRMGTKDAKQIFKERALIA